MARILPIVLLLSCATPLLGQERGSAEFRPIRAAEAARRVASTRDFVTDLLWLNTDPYWHKGEWDECLRLARQVIELDPHFVEAYTGAAWMLWSMDRDEEAIALYQAGSAANPGDHQIPHEFGLYYVYREHWGKAVEQFRKSVALGAPMHRQHMLPNALYRAGRKQEALAEWRAILERFSEDAVARRRIEALEKELAQEGD